EGEGGFMIGDIQSVKGVKEICEDNGIVFVGDEIESGFGRRGKRFGIEDFDVEGDLIRVCK
uniref:aminotransferase class III-fold pyridoxal phosphate-dependent enzyme n=1 Tax=Staphylococcus saprophyticus TaxID=29385 RepID=UPI0021B1704F